MNNTFKTSNYKNKEQILPIRQLIKSSPALSIQCKTLLENFAALNTQSKVDFMRVLMSSEELEQAVEYSFHSGTKKMNCAI